MSKYFCYRCGADWSDWPELSGAAREAVLEKLPYPESEEADPSLLLEGCCPSCGFSYHDEDEEGW